MIQVAARVTPVPIHFLWRQRLPLGTLSLIAGRPGSGKSQLSLFVAAELSTQGLVSVVSNPEDDLEAVVKPRLLTYGANEELIYLPRADQALTLPLEFEKLEDLIRGTCASLVVLDPIAAHFEPESSLHRRRILRQLVSIAGRTRCAILGIHHTVKGPYDPLAQVGGSLGGLVGASRAVYMFNLVPNGRYSLDCLKINGVAQPPPLYFRPSTIRVGQGLKAPRLTFIGAGFGDPDKVAQGSEWLTKYLAAGQDGHRLDGEIKIDGKKAGFSWTFLKALGADLGFMTMNGGPHWQLPADHPLRDGITF